MSAAVDERAEEQHLAELVLKFFNGRRSAYAVKVGKDYFPARDDEKKDLPLTLDVVLRHLNGGQRVGSYLFAGPGGKLIFFAALDFDDHKEPFLGWAKMWTAASAARDWLVAQGFRPCLFRSGGGRGVHVVLFWEEPQYAANVIALLHECLAVTDNVGVEVYPKQPEATEYGNLIALPFAGQSCLLDVNGNELPRESFRPEYSKNAPICEPGRDVALASYGGWLIRRKVDIDEAKHRVAARAKHDCVPEYPEGELARHVFKSMFKWEAKESKNDRQRDEPQASVFDAVRLVAITYQGDDFTARTDIKDPVFYYEGFQAAPSIWMVAGLSGIGKTWLMMHHWQQLTLGLPFMGFEVGQPLNDGIYIYVDSENMASNMRGRMMKFGPPPPMPGNMFILSSQDIYNTFHQMLMLDTVRDQLVFEQYMDAMEQKHGLPVRMLNFDHLSGLTTGFEEGGKGDRRYDPNVPGIGPWLVKQRSRGVSSILQHHTPKDQTKGASGLSAIWRPFNGVMILLPSESKSRDKTEFWASFDAPIGKIRDAVRPMPTLCTLQADEHGRLQMSFKRGEMPKEELSKETRRTTVLDYIARHSPKTQKAIVEGLNSYKQAVSRVVDELRGEGLLELDSLRLTAKGRAAAPEL